VWEYSGIVGIGPGFREVQDPIHFAVNLDVKVGRRSHPCLVTITCYEVLKGVARWMASIQSARLRHEHGTLLTGRRISSRREFGRPARLTATRVVRRRRRLQKRRSVDDADKQCHAPRDANREHEERRSGSTMTTEQTRLDEARKDTAPWKKWARISANASGARCARTMDRRIEQGGPETEPQADRRRGGRQRGRGNPSAAGIRRRTV